MKYPIDSKKDRLELGYWLGMMLGLLQASLSISSDPSGDLDIAKEVFSQGFTEMLPPNNSLNEIKVKDLFLNLNEKEEVLLWNTYSRLLTLWMGLQEETLPGVDESEAVSQQEFVNVLRLAIHNLKKLQ